MALPAKKKILSISEYFEMEGKAETRHEYYKGEIFAFAGASLRHSQIVSNTLTALNNKLKRTKCSSFSHDVKVRVEEFDFFTYPDILVICDKPKFYKDRDDTVLNPVLIIEVLSESTKNYDRGDKFEFYRSIKSLQDYVLIDQYRVHMEHFEKNKDGKWLLTEYADTSSSLELSHLNIELPLTDIYERVEFTKKG